jgi:hypothetical protein
MVEVFKSIYVSIEDKSTWLLTDIPQYHPDDPRHTDYWRDQKRKCIEGMWGKDFDGFRYMPGNLYFYVNFSKILHVDKKTKTRKMIKPWLRDLEWELAYMCLIARGFSGFERDDNYSCHESFIDEFIYPTPSCYRSNGELKEYMDPIKYVKRIHSQPLGLPIYDNNAKNTMVLGARGGGKSYWYGLGENLHELLFDGAKYYTQDSIDNPAEVHINIGSGATDKSAEMCAKIKASNDALAVDHDLGAWGKIGDYDYQPSIFYKDMTGSLRPNNAQSPWRHEYQVKAAGRWNTEGTKSKLVHTAYKDNAEAGAGGRYTKTTIEEVGLTENVIDAHTSNIATTQESSLKFGSQHYLGTAGNMQKIRDSQEMFTHPKTYKLVEYDDVWEHSGKIGFFLPASLTNNDFKDINGNTDWEKATEYYERRRKEAKRAKNPRIYEAELMNYPLVPSEMFIGREGRILPVLELKEQEKRLLKENKFELIGTPIDIYYDSSTPEGVEYKLLLNKQPIYNYPTPKNADIEGCIVMYEAPIRNSSGKIPNDLYNLVGYDPYVSENLDEGESLGSVYVMKNPKYLAQGYGGNEIVASYTGKHSMGTKAFNENVEKLLMMYGNPIRGLWFESDRGKHVKSYFENRNKLHLLCIQPNKQMSVSITDKKVTNYGWQTGNRINKIELLDMLAEWLKESTTIDGVTKQNLERIPDIALIREMIAFDLDKGNYDRVMALVGCVLALREYESQFLLSTAIKHNPLAVLANSKLFKTKNTKKYVKN